MDKIKLCDQLHQGKLISRRGNWKWTKRVVHMVRPWAWRLENFYSKWSDVYNSLEILYIDWGPPHVWHGDETKISLKRLKRKGKASEWQAGYLLHISKLWLHNIMGKQVILPFVFKETTLNLTQLGVGEFVYLPKWNNMKAGESKG